MSADAALVKERVQKHLVEFAGGMVMIDSDGDYSTRKGSARVFVSVMEHPNGEAVLVYVNALVLEGVPGTPEFLKFVATEDSLLFGTFLAVERPNGEYGLILRHMLLGDFLDKDELLYAVGNVLGAADHFDNELAARFGGRVFHPEDK